MKKFVSMMTSFAIIGSMLPAAFAENAAEAKATIYHPAPYAVEADSKGPTEYLAPVFYKNAEGPTIGVTYVGVIEQDGLFFKDSNNNHELDIFEDWRLDEETRAADLLSKLSTDQRVGLLGAQLVASPDASTIDEVRNADGKIQLNKLLALDEDALNTANYRSDGSWDDWYHVLTTGVIAGSENRMGVIRRGCDVETLAAFNNAANMTAEFGSVVKGNPVIPFRLVTNPVVGDYPSSIGMAATAMDGDYSVIRKAAELDRQIWDAKGVVQMYGPQIDLVTDPRWGRLATTYTEDPQINAGIARTLVEAYQNGSNGVQPGSVALIMKHFPGDGAAENGFESHSSMGQYRLYPTEGSLEKYQLVGFQAAVDAGVAGIMPCYSRDTADGRSVKQSYRGVELEAKALATAYNDELLGKLLHDLMGFKGFVNTDSGIIADSDGTSGSFGASYGAENLPPVERFAAIINAGSDIIGDALPDPDFAMASEAVTSGKITAEALDRANSNILTSVMRLGMFENPYRDLAESTAKVEALEDELAASISDANHKSVVLMKNHDNTLPLKNAEGKKVYIKIFTSNMAGSASSDSFTSNQGDMSVISEWMAKFEEAGYTIVDDYKEADIAFLDVIPGGVTAGQNFLKVLDLVDGMDVEARSFPTSQKKSGDLLETTTLRDAKTIKKIAEAVHSNGGKVIASVDISNPWILTNLEPYCDGMIGSFATNVEARMDVLTGAFNPVGKLPVTMVACDEVIAVNEQEIDGNIYEVCVSPNDVPGYDKDQYMDADVLAQSPSGSYAYQDADGNYYRSSFGLSY